MQCASTPSHDRPAGYLITFTTYGARLHGDDRGSVERVRHGGGFRPVPPDFLREQQERKNLRGGTLTLDTKARAVVADAIAEVARFKGWQLHLVNVRTNHVHLVVSGDGTPERMMNTLKSWATRRLREAELARADQKVWTRHGSTRYLWTESAIEQASIYVFEGQGSDIGGVRGGEED